MNFLSLSAGTNSTALLILLCEGKLPQYTPFQPIFCETGCEKDETYAYFKGVLTPYLLAHGMTLQVLHGEHVIERWRAYHMVGMRISRSCTEHSKIRPMHRYLRSIPGDHLQMIGIDAGERHRAEGIWSRSKGHKIAFPLVDLEVNREGCKQIIRDAGLCQPGKSGCWCCPFMPVFEVLKLAREQPEKMEIVRDLESNASIKYLKPVAQWYPHQVQWWIDRAQREGDPPPGMFQDDDKPCECFDG